jgi:hydroxyacylglutathione hydrolase
MLAIQIIPVLRDNYSFLLHDPDSGQTAVVDPAEAAPVLQILDQRGWQLHTVLNTHHHHDHVGGNLALQAATGCQIIASHVDRTRIPGLTQTVTDGDCLYLGQNVVQVLTTPGHTDGHIAYYCADSESLFCGDTLFVMGCGRLFEGTAAQLWQSLQKLAALPPQTRVYCAHEYSLANAHFALSVEPDNPVIKQRLALFEQRRAAQQPTIPSTLADELASNPFLRTPQSSVRQPLPTAKTPLEIFTCLRQMKDGFLVT